MQLRTLWSYVIMFIENVRENNFLLNIFPNSLSINKVAPKPQNSLIDQAL